MFEMLNALEPLVAYGFYWKGTDDGNDEQNKIVTPLKDIINILEKIVSIQGMICSSYFYVFVFLRTCMYGFLDAEIKLLTATCITK